MSEKYKIDDQELNIISGGVLKEGWQQTMIAMMALYKGKYGEEGLEIVKALPGIAVNDPTSPIEAGDFETLHKFIDEQWPQVEARILP